MPDEFSQPSLFAEERPARETGLNEGEAGPDEHEAEPDGPQTASLPSQPARKRASFGSLTELATVLSLSRFT